MTPEQHNKYVGVAHLVYAGLYLLFTLLFMLFFLAVFVSSVPNGNDAGLGFFVVFWAFFSIFWLAFIVPSFIAGYGLLKHKKWARTAAIIGGVVSAMSFPIGTAVCVYTFWFLFSEPGRVLYDRPAYPLPPPPPLWSRDFSESSQQRYIPPSSPPDWR